jgi:hypothetical protein
VLGALWLLPGRCPGLGRRRAVFHLKIHEIISAFVLFRPSVLLLYNYLRTGYFEREFAEANGDTGDRANAAADTGDGVAVGRALLSGSCIIVASTVVAWFKHNALRNLMLNLG